MKKNIKKDKETVVIYALYNEEYYDIYDCSDALSIDCDREEKLKKYCEEKEYEIKEIFRNNKSDYLPYKLKCFLEVIYKYQTIHFSDVCYVKINKIIIYDIYDVCSNINEFNVIFEMANRDHIKIETIKQGIISSNSFNELEVSNNEK